MSEVAAAGADNIVRIWPLPTGAAKDLPPLPAAITALAVLPTDKTQLFCATADGAVRQINLQNNQVARQFDILHDRWRLGNSHSQAFFKFGSLTGQVRQPPTSNRGLAHQI